MKFLRYGIKLNKERCPEIILPQILDIRLLMKRKNQSLSIIQVQETKITKHKKKNNKISHNLDSSVFLRDMFPSMEMWRVKTFILVSISENVDS